MTSLSRPSALLTLTLALAGAACTFPWEGRGRTFPEPPAGSYTVKTRQLVFGDVSTPIDTAEITSEFFKAVQVKPMLGRFFVPDEYGAAPIRVGVLSHGLWQERFGGSPGVIGQNITLDGRSIAIVGIAEPGFSGPPGVGVWLPQEHLWLIAPPGTQPDIGPGTTRAQLAARFGVENLRPADVQLGEGETAKGISVQLGDASSQVEIVWKSADLSATPGRIQVTGQRTRWAIAPGITLGSTLQEIERVNGRSFTLAGFDWDYSGTVLDWNGGRLQDLQTGSPRVFVRVSPPDGSNRDADRRSVSGDRDFLSTVPPMQRLNPRVYQLVLLYEL